jgi:phasin
MAQFARHAHEKPNRRFISRRGAAQATLILRCTTCYCAAQSRRQERAMAEQQRSAYEIPSEMREFAEKSVDQARKAFDGFIGAAQKTVDTIEGSANTVQANAKDATRKTLSYAEQNIAAAFDLAQRLVRAKDVQEAMQAQAEFVRSQYEAMQAQMKEIGSLAQSAMKPPGSGPQG